MEECRITKTRDVNAVVNMAQLESFANL